MANRVAISSLQNDRIKAIRALEMRKVRKETGLFVAEGVSVLAMAMEQGVPPRTLVLLAGSAEDGMARRLVSWAEDCGSDIIEVNGPVLGKLAAKENPQTMLGVFEQRFGIAPTPSLLAPAQTWIALEEVRDPGNLGTIIRTAHAAGVAGILLVGNCCDPYSRECVRASMGSIFAASLVRITPEQFLALLGNWPGDSVATDLEATTDFRAGRFRGPELVVMGSEGPGLRPDTAQACKRRVRIPMAGTLDSLNLAVATALMIYEIRRGRL